MSSISGSNDSPAMAEEGALTRFFRATDSSELADAYRTIDALEPMPRQGPALRPRHELFRWPLLGALVLLLLAILITGIAGKPIALPRPVVNAIRLQPPAPRPVSDTGSYPGVSTYTNPRCVTGAA